MPVINTPLNVVRSGLTLSSPAYISSFLFIQVTCGDHIYDVGNTLKLAHALFHKRHPTQTAFQAIAASGDLSKNFDAFLHYRVAPAVEKELRSTHGLSFNLVDVEVHLLKHDGSVFECYTLDALLAVQAEQIAKEGQEGNILEKIDTRFYGEVRNDAVKESLYVSIGFYVGGVHYIYQDYAHFRKSVATNDATRVFRIGTQEGKQFLDDVAIPEIRHFVQTLMDQGVVSREETVMMNLADCRGQVVDSRSMTFEYLELSARDTVSNVKAYYGTRATYDEHKRISIGYELTDGRKFWYSSVGFIEWNGHVRAFDVSDPLWTKWEDEAIAGALFDCMTRVQGVRLDKLKIIYHDSIQRKQTGHAILDVPRPTGVLLPFTGGSFTGSFPTPADLEPPQYSNSVEEIMGLLHGALLVPELSTVDRGMFGECRNIVLKNAERFKLTIADVVALNAELAKHKWYAYLSYPHKYVLRVELYPLT